MNCEELLRSNLPLVERIVRRVCNRARFPAGDVDDFSSTVKLALIENDYAVLRAWQQRSSLATYLAVVIQRMLSDERNRTLGRWRPSSEAKRLGETAVLLETLVRRDERPIAEVIPIVRAVDPALSPAEIEALAARLPLRAARLRVVPIDTTEELPATRRADEQVMDGEIQKLSARANVLIRSALEALPLHDRMLVRLHFASMMTISDIARILQVPQRPLYRRLEQILASIRSSLAEADIDAGTAGELIGSAIASLDFGLSDGKTDTAWQSAVGEEPDPLEGRP